METVNKREMIEELARLYVLRDEGKKVDRQVTDLEAMLCRLMDCDGEED